MLKKSVSSRRGAKQQPCQNVSGVSKQNFSRARHIYSPLSGETRTLTFRGRKARARLECRSLQAHRVATTRLCYMDMCTGYTIIQLRVSLSNNQASVHLCARLFRQTHGDTITCASYLQTTRVRPFSLRAYGSRMTTLFIQHL